MDEIASPLSQTANPIVDAAGGPSISSERGRLYLRNVSSSLIKMLIIAGTGLFLPAYLTHHLSTIEYGGWILILQIASYINYLDLGVQTAIAKYVAEYTSSGSSIERDRHASAGVVITTCTAALGIVLSAVLGKMVPLLFPSMPHAIQREVARGVFLMGTSTAFLLATSPFAALFLGLQRFGFSAFVESANRILYTVVLVVAVMRHTSLTRMASEVAVLNVVTALVYLIAWRISLPHIHVRLSLISVAILKKVLGYCAVLGIWTASMLIITGLDTALVGHFEFSATAYYAIAAAPVAFLIPMLGAVMSPLMPAFSALSVSSSAASFGELLTRTTRYITVLLELSGLPLILFGYLILSLWTSSTYAEHSLQLMRILLLANIVRNLWSPYATMVVATGSQRKATLAAIAEASVNLASSIFLAFYFGALGVALGTLLGAIVGVSFHLSVSMKATQKIVGISRRVFLRSGILRALIASVPTLALLPLFLRARPVPYTPLWIAVWIVATAALTWRYALDASERGSLVHKFV